MKRSLRPKIKATRVANAKKIGMMRKCYRMIRIPMMKNKVNEVYLRTLKTRVMNGFINN